MDLREDNATETIKDSLLNARFPGVTVSKGHDLQTNIIVSFQVVIVVVFLRQ